MRYTTFALASLAAVASAASIDISGAYWDATISTQTGRPGYSIRDLVAQFNNPKLEQSVGGTCHYSFVPQGTSPPAVTDTCDTGLSYTWDYTTLSIKQRVPVEDYTLELYGNANVTTQCSGSGDAGGRKCTGTVKIEVDHYCKLIGEEYDGCYAPNGTA